MSVLTDAIQQSVQQASTLSSDQVMMEPDLTDPAPACVNVGGMWFVVEDWVPFENGGVAYLAFFSMTAVLIFDPACNEFKLGTVLQGYHQF